MQVQHKHAGSQVAPYSGIKRAVVRGFFRPPFLEPRLVSASDEPHVLTVRSRSRALRPAGYYLPDSATERLTEYGATAWRSRIRIGGVGGILDPMRLGGGTTGL